VDKERRKATLLTQLQNNGHLTTEDDMAMKQVTAAPSQEVAEEKVSKSSALKEALRDLGEDAKNSDLEDWIRKKYGDDAVPANM
jgi:hypothetical protein